MIGTTKHRCWECGKVPEEHEMEENKKTGEIRTFCKECWYKRCFVRKQVIGKLRNE